MSGRFGIFLGVLLLLFAFSPAQAMDAPHTSAKQAILLDYDTVTILLAKNADQKVPTSSMSKVITMYVVFEALKKGDIQLDTDLDVSEKAWAMGGSKMFVPVGKTVKVEDLIRGVIIQSGNDATIVLAEGLSGTEDIFAAALNQKAAELGMENSHFVNASGWPDENHYSTVRDLARLSLKTIEDFPEYYKYFAEKEFTYNNIRQENRNPLLYKNIGADGLKTGHTESGGYGLMASGTRDGRRVVLVLNGMESKEERAKESGRLLDWGLRVFQNMQLFEAGETVEEAPVSMGKAKKVPLVLGAPLLLTVPKMEKNAVHVEAKYPKPLDAPVVKGAQVGTLVVTIPSMAPMEYPLLAGEEVEKLGFFKAWLERLKIRIGGMMSHE